MGGSMRSKMMRIVEREADQHSGVINVRSMGECERSM